MRTFFLVFFLLSVVLPTQALAQSFAVVAEIQTTNAKGNWKKVSSSAEALLVLDDALASVDNNTAAEILASVRRQTQRTILMISHQLSAAAACDRILVLEQGRLVQQGHHNDLIVEQGLYRSLWEREQAAERLDAVA